MERFYKNVSSTVDVSSIPMNGSTFVEPQISEEKVIGGVDSQPQASPKEVNIEVDLENLPIDPGLHPNIMSYPPNLIEQVRRAYLLKGRSEKGHDSFVSGGFNCWRKKERLRYHVGDHTSEHNRCRLACEDLMNQAQHIEVSLSRVSKQSKIDYRCRLNASIVCLRYLIMQGLAFRGNDESEGSLNQGNFIELLKVVASCNEDISNVVLTKAPENLKLTSPEIQSDIINAFATETTKAIISDIGNDFFSILVDECRDISVKEQMGVVVYYVDKNGYDSLLSTHGLSVSSLRGQGNDGASSMRGEFKGLKSLILKRNPSAYYVHCFAHQLQLILVAVSKKHTSIGSFFNTVTHICNVAGDSCKCRDMLRESQREKIIEAIANDEIKTGRGLNQEMALKWPGDTRWSSHYGTLINLIHLFSSIVDVLEYVGKNGNDDAQRADVIDLLEVMNRFEFVFVLHLMRQLLWVTHELSQVLQRKDQNIVNAINLVKVAKARLQAMRDHGWEILITEVSKFCSTNEIVMLDMGDKYVARGRGRRRIEKMTNLHHYRVELFCSVIDIQVQELNQRFDEVNTELLLCMICLDPKDSFSAFDVKKLLRLAKFYPSEFSEVVLYELESQLENFIFGMRLDEKFSKVSGIGGLAQKIVSTRKPEVFPLVYLLVKLSLVLPVATATVERAFSAMKFIKNALRNRMGDKLLNDCLVSYIEKDVFVNVTNETIMQQFQNMKNRREML